MKLDMTEEDIKERILDEVPNILFTRKIPHMMLEFSKRIAKKMSTHTVIQKYNSNYSNGESI
jgi:uncharacterized protein with ATP-grasp and redox domains